MNSNRKFIIKLEVCRDLIQAIWSDEAAPTIEYMKSELDYIFKAEEKELRRSQGLRELRLAGRFIMEKKEDIKSVVPEPMPPLFVVSAITHILSDLEGTTHYDKVEHVLDGSYGLEDFVKKDNYEDRVLACKFADNLEDLMDNYR